MEAWIELAGVLEQSDIPASLQAYQTAVRILQNKVKVDIPPEIHNNIASCLFRLERYRESKQHYGLALQRARQERKQDEAYYGAISVTTTYNMARLHEALHEHDKAEGLYKNILREHPSYVDCIHIHKPMPVKCLLQYFVSRLFETGMYGSGQRTDL